MTTTRHRTPALPRPATALIALLTALALAGCGSGSIATGGIDPAAPAATTTSAPTTAPEATTAPAGNASATPTFAPTTSPAPEPPRTTFKMNLYRTGDFAAQYTFDWCVGASLQMALNMTTGDTVTSRSSQQDLWEMAQARSSSPFGGANPRGWTAALNGLGIGPYTLVSIPDYGEALRVAATAIRETKRPVGLVMWRGRHAWVMSGFESNGDPAIHADIEVTGIRVLDPLYPHGSSVWGRSPKPNTLVTPATLAKQFVIRDRGRVNLGVPPGYLLVLPTRETGVTQTG